MSDALIKRMKALPKEHSLTRQMGLLFVGRGVAFLLTFSIPLVLVRIFTPEAFGPYKPIISDSQHVGGYPHVK